MSVIANTRNRKDSGQSATIMAVELDSKTYYLPQVDLITFENIHNLEEAEKSDSSVAAITIGSYSIPVYCLSDDFELLDYIPDERKVCIISGHGDRQFGILCDKIHKLSYTEIKFESVPACMNTQSSPLSDLFLYRPEIGDIQMGMMLRSQSLLSFLDNSLKFNAA